MADTNIIPPQGALTASGNVMRVITIGLVLFGFTPTVIATTENAILMSSSGEVTIQGHAPYIGNSSLSYTVTPPSGRATFGLNNNSEISSTSGSLALVGSAPAVSLSTTVTPSDGAVVLTGVVPVVGQGVVGTSGVLTLTGVAPTVRESIGQAILVLQGYTPSVTSAATTISPSVGTLTFGISSTPNTAIAGVAGALSFQGHVPLIANPQNLIPTAGSAILQGYGPIISNSALPTAGTLVIQGASPILNTQVIPGSATLKCSPWALISWTANTEPDLSYYKVYHGVVSGTYTSSVNVGLVTQYVWNDLSIGTHYFCVTATDTSGNESARSAEVSTVISGSGHAPTITIGTGSGIQIDTGIGSATLTGAVPVVGLGVVPTTGALALTGQLAPPDTGTLTLTGITPSVTMGGPLNFTVVPGSTSLTLVGYAKLQYAEPAWGVLTFQGAAGAVTIQELGSVSMTPSAGSLVFFAPTPFNPNLAQHANSIWAPGGTPDHA